MMSLSNLKSIKSNFPLNLKKNIFKKDTNTPKFLYSPKPSLASVPEKSTSQFLQRSDSPTIKIDFSRVSVHTKNKKDFVVLINGFPAQNKTYHIEVNNPDHSDQKLMIPLIKTDDKGVVSILAKPSYDQNYQINHKQSVYRPIKFSKRLGFVFKDSDTDKKSKNSLYRKKFISHYLDIGLSEHFLRSLILHSDNGNKTVNASKSPVIHNWLNLTNSKNDISKEFRAYNTHTERTQKALKYTNYLGNGLITSGAVSLLIGASIATAGAASIASLGIGGSILALGHTVTTPHHIMRNQPADISRERDTQISALENMRSIEHKDQKETPKTSDKKKSTNDISKKEIEKKHSEKYISPISSSSLSNVSCGKIEFPKNI